MKLIKIQLLAVLLISAMACQNTEQNENADLAVPHGDDVGDASLTDEDLKKMENSKGKTVETIDFADLQDFIADTEGELVVCNFWATWCEPCIKEMPYFEQLQREFYDKNLNVVFVSLDKLEDESKINAFMLKHQITSQVVMMNDETPQKEWMQKLNKNWNGEIPATFFVNSNNEINDFHPGAFANYGALKAKILPYL